MNKTFDSGPLSWVKGEIDLALTQASRGMADFAAVVATGAPSMAALQVARNHLHQASGALIVVGIDGVTVVSQAIESLLTALAEEQVADVTAAIDAAEQGLAAVRDYLDGLVTGEPHQTLRLFPAYRTLMLARGLASPSPAELFFPDLTQRPPRRTQEPPAISAEALRARLRAARLGFDRGLVKWLKGDGKGVGEMKATLNMIELTRTTPASRAVWWVSLGVLDALGVDGLSDIEASRRFLLRLAAQIKRLSDATDPQQFQAPDALLREALYLVATATQGHAALTVVRSAYRLDTLLPVQAHGDAETSQTDDTTHWRELIRAAKSEWKRLADGAIAALPPFHKQVTELAKATAHAPPDYARLTAMLREQADALRRDPALHNDALAQEIATALLLAETELQHYPNLAADFGEQVQLLSERLALAARCETPGPLVHAGLAPLAHRAQAEMLRTAMARDVGVQLTAVEQALDVFFRDPSRRDVLAAMRQPLQHAREMLATLGETHAMEILAECTASIERLLENPATAQPKDFKDMAKRFAALGLHVARLAQGAAAGQLFAPHAVTEIAANTVAVHEPSAEAVQDIELLRIFLQEAQEILAEFHIWLPRLHDVMANRDALANIRRGFHTLKGSGRMVGLHALGEAAWAVEQVLNRWLDEHREVTPELLALLDMAVSLFDAWVAQLAAGGESARDADELLARCATLTLPVADAETVVSSSTTALSAVTPAPTFSAAVEVTPSSNESSLTPLATTSTSDATMAAEPAQSTSLPLPEPSVADVLIFPEKPPVRIGEADISPLRYNRFLETARDRLAILQETLGRETVPTQDTIDAAQTLATEAAQDFPALAHLAHALADALIRFAHGYGVPDDSQRFLFARCAGALAGMLGAIAERRMPGEETELAAALADLQLTARVEPPSIVEATDNDQILAAFFEESGDLLQEIGSHLRAWRAAPDSAASAQAVGRALHTLKGSARMAGALACGELLHDMESRVEAAAAALPVAPESLDALEASLDLAATQIEQLRYGETATPQPTVLGALGTETLASPAAQALLRVRTDLVDQWVNEAGEIAIARTRIEGEMRGIKTALRDLSESVTRLRNHLREVEIQAETQMLSQQAVVADNAAGFDPLELDRFTRFQEATRMLAESVDDVAAVQHSLRLNLEHTDTALAAQARLNRSLSQRLLHARMVPFDSIAERLHRVVRQAARDTGKSVNLDIRAGHIEMDRSVLEKIAGSIEHLLRNGVAHGIEDETARYRAGKPMPGRLSIALSQTGNDVCIDIEDDGAGLDFERIRRRGIESGLLAQDAPAEPAMLIPLLFHAGFSTAAEVTQLSGRGVGLGVVKTDINALGGRIDVTSEAGKGTRFRLTLPLTLALTQAALVQAGGRRYAIPATMLEQAIRQTPEAMDAIRQAGRLEVQGAFYPWHYLSHLLDDRAASPAPNGWLLQIKSGTDCLALAVDGFDEPREIVVKPLGPQLSRVPGLLGATVMADGEIVLLFNPIALLMRTAAWQAAAPTEETAAALSPVSKPAAIETQPVVMVVDDSLTVRKITSRLLSRHGYRVLTARDGVDALEQLRTEMPAVLLVDIEMPRMDGFALTRAVRTDARLAHLPIIVITSRIAEKHRQHAFEAGVNHYLGKPYNEDELLRLIADFTAQEKS